MRMESDPIYNEQERQRVLANAELAEAARDSVDLLCKRILPLVFDRVQAMLAVDRQEIDLYVQSGAQPGATAEVYVSPNMSDGPMRTEEPQESLTLLLKHSEGGQLAEALRIYLPLQRDNYVYPDPLHEEEDMPRELFFDYLPYGIEGVINQRFVMQKDTMDFSERYRIFKYDSAADGGKQQVYDTISDIEQFIDPSVFEKYHRGLPADANLAVWLIDLMSRLDETVQKEVSIRDEQ
jgi:hypothetical protein